MSHILGVLLQQLHSPLQIRKIHLHKALYQLEAKNIENSDCNKVIIKKDL